MQCIEDLCASLEAAVESAAAAEKAAFYFDVWLMEFRNVPDEVFRIILRGIEQNVASMGDHEARLLRLVDIAWDHLTSGQHDQCVATMESLYSRLADWRSCFVVTDLLGRRSNNERCFNALLALSRTDEGVHRALTAHGFGYAARIGDVHIREQALRLLHEMTKDNNDRVRIEAEEALRVVRKGGRK